ncbi:MAG: hypothetical protein EA365_03955 [Gloeocapsa sp. DLM2.Bin57]|nr:MAG: hypothetical protein EA365_03955 [Gloeocapsa sp. DLM2.Bin57]
MPSKREYQKRSHKSQKSGWIWGVLLLGVLGVTNHYRNFSTLDFYAVSIPDITPPNLAPGNQDFVNIDFSDILLHRIKDYDVGFLSFTLRDD